MRPLATGVHLQNIVDMHVEVYNAGGGFVARYTKDTDPDVNPIVDVELELDGLGCLIKGKINLSDRWFQPPFSLEIIVWLIDQIHGVVPVGRGYQEVIGFTADTIESSVDIQAIEKLEIEDQYQGYLPVQVPGVTIGGFNLTPGMTVVVNEDPSDKKQSEMLRTNQDVLNELTSKYPTLTYGVDGYGRSIIGDPQSGTPIVIKTEDTYGLVPNNHVINDYYTKVTATGEKGWASYSASRAVGRLTPKRFKEIGAPATKEVTVSYGGPVFLLAQIFTMPIVFTLNISD